MANSASNHESKKRLATHLRDIAERLEELDSHTWARCLSTRVEQAKFELRRRAKIGDLFGNSLFTDPSIFILLDLFIAEEQGKLTSISSACAVSGVAPTTALRYIQSLEGYGHVVRENDPTDRRRVLLRMTREARQKMEVYLNWANSDQPLDCQ